MTPRPTPSPTARSAPTVTAGPSSATLGRPVPTIRTLPLDSYTGNARQVITVVAATADSTTATLRSWKAGDDGWQAVGPSVRAFLGTDGLSAHPTEALSATPIGSFTLTTSFGHDRNPGTALPYTRTAPADWWISQPGPLYNTFQRCSSNCPFAQGEPNEHLYYETPAYDHAVVIDYNTTDSAAGVRQNAGSAFFLHVSEGKPTAGCVSIPNGELSRIMRWLDPSRHPRIVIGVKGQLR